MCDFANFSVESVPNITYLVTQTNASTKIGCGDGDDRSSTDKYGWDEAATLPTWLLPPLGVVLSCISLFTVLSNVFVAVAVVRERFLRTVTNSFIVSLSLADFIMGVVVMPLAIVYDLNGGVWNMDPLLCDVWKASEILSAVGCIGNISLISLDRYVAVVHPLQYRRRLSRRKAMIMILVVWCLAVSLSFPCIVWWHATKDFAARQAICDFTLDARNYNVTALSSLLILAVIFIFAYLRIYMIAMRQLKHITEGRRRIKYRGESSRKENMEIRIHRGGSEGSNCEVPEFLEGTRRAKKLSREFKTAKIVGIIVLTFFVCWMPFIATEIKLCVCGDYCIDMSYKVYRCFRWLIYINSALNPLIYARASDHFMLAFRRLWWSVISKIPLFKSAKPTFVAYNCSALQKENSIRSDCLQTQSPV
ncbi:5-hydroxytryptamine receptor 1D-like [Ptychodera flava]|uniref:5-hydroxytryptamine receptor 1D-like n=1 Tax=Ptychodera flava TaxID=63121 RepID=UPI00396A2BCA